MSRRKSLILGVVGSSINSDGSYTVNLNGQWEATTAIPNPDSTLYDGVYRSSSNYNVNNGVSTMYIDISGYSEFTLYIRSYAESNYDYVMVSQLDQTITGSTSYSNTTLVKAHTRGNQKSGTTISDYTEVKYTNIDGGSHRITILYRKDGSSHSGDDRGYVLIKKQNASGGEDGGDVEIDTTYAIYYTSSDGNIVEPFNLDALDANIVSNNYINGQGIISFDGPVTTIGDYAFRSCTSLTSVTIPDSVTTIGDHSFYDCDSLTSVTIPDSVTTIGERAFYSCDSLTSVTIPNSVTTIEACAFCYCASLKEFKGKFAADNGRCLIVDGVLNSFAIGCGATDYTIPDSVTTIGERAFYYCTSLTSVTIRDSVTTIGDYAFYYCTSLTSVTIPDSVTTIGYEAFSDCNSLTSITIPNSVTTIGERAFYSCDSLTSVYCKAATPPSLNGTYVFDYNKASRLIYVPTNSVNAYKSATNWSEYASSIVGYNF